MLTSNRGVQSSQEPSSESRIPLFGASRIPARRTNNPSANHQDVAPDPPAAPKQRHLFQYGGVGSKKSLFKNLFGGGSLRRTKETLPTAADKPRTNEATFSLPEPRVRDDLNRPIVARPSDDLESGTDDVFQSPSAKHKDWTYLIDGRSSNSPHLRMSDKDASGAEGNGRTFLVEQRPSHASRPRSSPHDVSPTGKTGDNLLALAKSSSDIFDDPTFTDLPFDHPSATSSPLVELPLVGPSMVGQRVRVGGRKRGTLMYYGPIQCDAGVFCGVELDEPEGLNDGSLKGTGDHWLTLFYNQEVMITPADLSQSVSGCNPGLRPSRRPTRYFQCRPNHGIIAPVDKVTMFPSSAASTTNHRLRKDTYVSDQPHGPASVLGDVTTTRQTQEEELEQPCISKKGPGLFLPSTDQHQSQGSSEVSTPTPGSSTSGGATAMEWSSKARSSDPFARYTGGEEFPWSKYFEQSSNFSLLDDQVLPYHDTLERLDGSDAVGSFEPPRDLPDRLSHDAKIQSDVSFTPASDRTLSPEDLPLDPELLGHPVKMSEIGEMTELTGDEWGLLPPSNNSLKLGFIVLHNIEEYSENTSFRGSGVTITSWTLIFTELVSVPASTTSAGPSSRSSVAPAANSFVTSVTSIASLDNGYQGDGECSRPASRGADHSPTAGHRPAPVIPPPPPPPVRVKPPCVDAMTDSDFFTESDADGHDELSNNVGEFLMYDFNIFRDEKEAVGTGGPKSSTGPCTAVTGRPTTTSSRLPRAYGGMFLNNQQPPPQSHQRYPSYTASINEEMESSGIYSDLERRPDETLTLDKTFLTEINSGENGSPDGSTKTLSSKSEQSQVAENVPALSILFQDSVVSKTMDVTTTDQLLVENNLKNQPNLVTTAVTDAKQEAMDTSPGLLKNEAVVTQGGKSSAQRNCKDEPHPGLKKYNMPKRNVASKIKAMIESSPAGGSAPGTCNAGSASTEDENQENRRPPRPTKMPRKDGRWDVVMNKIAMGKAENKLTSKNLKEVKSKVFANITLSSAQQQGPSGGEGSPRAQSGLAKRAALPPSNSRPNRDNALLKTKSRRSRTRASSSSLPHQGPTGLLRSSANSSPHSSISDVSQGHQPATKSVSALSEYNILYRQLLMDNPATNRHKWRNDRKRCRCIERGVALCLAADAGNYRLGNANVCRTAASVSSGLALSVFRVAMSDAGTKSHIDPVAYLELITSINSDSSNWNDLSYGYVELYQLPFLPVSYSSVIDGAGLSGSSYSSVIDGAGLSGSSYSSVIDGAGLSGSSYSSVMDGAGLSGSSYSSVIDEAILVWGHRTEIILCYDCTTDGSGHLERVEHVSRVVSDRPSTLILVTPPCPTLHPDYRSIRESPTYPNTGLSERMWRLYRDDLSFVQTYNQRLAGSFRVTVDSHVRRQNVVM
uniref:CAP-Gly domain-containing protein n=1 Tax=Timema tahoe TaxID=61484 RepID=A0A7R9NWE1_9NEOP|nr:unnamed protein product [Timema tahoe]